MNTIPHITEQAIRALVDEASFQRGQNYFRAGNIFDTLRQGMTLKARCQGSLPQAYRVQVTFDDDAIIGNSCTCPLGGYCKHVAALLLTWLDSPEEFIEQPEVDTLLDQYSKAQLITLIKKMLQRDPDLEILLPTAGPHQAPINSEIYRRQVASAFRNAGNEWGAESDIAEELFSIKDIGDSFVQQQDYTNALVVYEAIVTGIIEDYDSYHDEEGEVGGVLNEIVDELSDYLDNVQDDRLLREKIMQVLFEIIRFDVESGGIGIGEDAPDILVDHTTAEERRIIASWVRDALAESEDRHWSS